MGFYTQMLRPGAMLTVTLIKDCMNKCRDCGKTITNPKHYLCYACWQKQQNDSVAGSTKPTEEGFDLIDWLIKYLDNTGVRRGSHMTHWRESNWTTWGILIFLVGGPLLSFFTKDINTGFVWGAVIGFSFCIIGAIRTGH